MRAQRTSCAPRSPKHEQDTTCAPRETTTAPVISATVYRVRPASEPDRPGSRGRRRGCSVRSGPRSDRRRDVQDTTRASSAGCSSKGQFSSLDEPTAAPGQSLPLGLSSNGRSVAGEYTDASGVNHGYLATLAP
jgi:hypothetical protein